MKTIREGTKPNRRPSWVGQRECRECKCVIELDENDAHLLKPVHAGGLASVFSMECPTCKHEMHVS